MKIRWLALLLLVVLAGLSPADVIVIQRPSHKPIDNGIGDDRNPQARLRARLQASLREEEQKQFASGIEELARKFLNDPKLRKSLLEKVNKDFKPEDLERLKKQFEKGSGINLQNPPPALKRLLEEGRNQKAGELSPEEQKLLQKFQQQFPSMTQPGSTGPIPGTRPPDMGSTITPPPVSQQPATPPAQPSSPSQPPADSMSWDRLGEETPEWLKKGIDQAAGDFGKWIDSPSGKSWRDSFLDVAKKVAEARSEAPAVSGRLRSVGRYLPNVRDWLPRRGPDLPSARLPNMPRMPTPPSLPNVTAEGLGKGLLIAVAVVVAALLLWYSRGWWQGVLAARLAGWKLGPWPVRPGAVTTRGDLVRAFEYLALLCLGAAARTCHHLELARRIGEQPALDADRRREAAVDLAHIYEQARYTPDDEPLPDELLVRARRELSYLAGEPAA
jgi:hypothetical protein